MCVLDMVPVHSPCQGSHRPLLCTSCSSFVPSSSVPSSLPPLAFRSNALALFTSLGTKDSIKGSFSGISIDFRNYDIELHKCPLFSISHIKCKMHKNDAIVKFCGETKVRWLIILARIRKFFTDEK